MTQPHPQPDNCIHGKLCTSLCDYLKEMYIRAYPKCIDVMVMDCPHYCATHTPAAPAELLCDDCNIIELEERLMNLEQELKDARKAEREKVLEWAKKHNWPTTGGHRVIGFDKLKEFLESLRGGAP